MRHDDAEGGAVDGGLGLDVLVAALLEHLRAEHAGHAGDGADGHGDDGVDEAGTEHGGGDDHQEHAGDGLDDVQNAHDEVVDPAAVVARDGADRAADERCQGNGTDADRDGIARADDDAAEDVAPEVVAAEPVLGGGAGVDGQKVHGGVVIGRDHRGEDGDDDLQDEDHEADHGELVLAELLEDADNLALFLGFLFMHSRSPPSSLSRASSRKRTGP